MPLSFKERRKILKNANFLDLTPYHVYNANIDEKGIVTILVPKFTNKFAVKFILPRLKSSHFNIKLDELGSQTWKMVDGKTNVAGLAEKLINIFGEKIQPVYERLTKFLTIMYLEGYISYNEIKKGGE